MALYDKSGHSHSETALAAVIYKSGQVRPCHRAAAALTPGSQAFASLLCPSSRFIRPGLQDGRPPPTPSTLMTQPPSLQDKIVISQDEVLTNNGNVKWLPYKTRMSLAPAHHLGPHWVRAPKWAAS